VISSCLRSLIVLLASASILPVSAQVSPASRPNNSPEFTVHARAVVVDVVATRAGDQPISGLLRQDFKVLEDGKEQTIDFFEEHVPVRLDGRSSSALPPGVYTNRPPVQNDSVVVLLLDELNTAPQDQHALFSGVGEFVKSLPPGARVAIFLLRSKLELVRGFATDISALQSALKHRNTSIGADGAAGLRTQQDDAEDQMAAALFAESGAHYNGGEALRDLQTNQRITATLRSLEELGRNLAGVPGRKSLFWFSGSFPLSLFPQNGSAAQALVQQNEALNALQRATGSLAESKIAVYPVSVQGVVNDLSTQAATRSEEFHGGDIAQAEAEQKEMRNGSVAAMEHLALETGGRAIYNTNDFRSAASRAAQDNERYYTLVYAPPTGELDGKFRHIEVKVDQPGVKLAYRRGYYAWASVRPLEVADPLPRLMVPGLPPSTQILYTAHVEQVSPQPPADAPRAGGNATLNGPRSRYRVEFKVAPSGFDLETSPGGARTGRIEAGLVGYDRNGKALNWAGSQIDISLSPLSYEEAQRSGFATQLEIDLPPQVTSLATGVYDLNSQRAGTLEVPLPISVSAPEAPQKEASQSTAGSARAPVKTDGGPQPAIEAGVLSQPEPVRSSSLPDPVLLHRPAPKATGTAMREGSMFLDVVVSDAADKPVPGLEPWDFKLLDNDRSTKIMSFHSFGEAAAKPDPPVEVILVIDELNLPFQQAAFVKSEIARFLAQNGGSLAQPVSLMLLNESGLQVQPRPSTDGNALLEVVKGIKGHISVINPAMGAEGAVDRFQRSVRQMQYIADNEARKPGRKLLIWVGPGWPMLQSAAFKFNERDRRIYFDTIVKLTNQLREARIVVYSVAPNDSSMGGGPGRALLYKAFLKGVETERQADVGNLGLKVLVTQTGGLILGPDNDLAGQINRCIADANAFYRLSFNSPPAQHAHEYHELSLEVKQAGATARTNAGYYNEPPDSGDH
jgi:VWFA-related protein